MNGRRSAVGGTSRANARGFTLVELVAAFAIFALGFGVLLQILSTCLHTTTQAADYTRAALWAESLLDVQGVGEPLREGEASGRFDDRYRWQLSVRKLPPPSPLQAPVAGAANAPVVPVAAPPPVPIELYQLELVVSWDSFYLTHHARFVTLRAQNADSGNPLAPRTATPAAMRPVPGAKP
jgi:general secretion pathway protein I